MSRTFPVVGIDVSAEGLEDLEAFLAAIPTDSGLACIVTGAASPDDPGIAEGLAGSGNGATVTPVADGERLAPGDVYLVPKGAICELDGGRLRLREQASTGRVAHLFASFARESAQQTIAVLLSGVGDSAPPGLEEMRSAGVPVIASLTGRASENPFIDLILPPGEMPARILAIMSRRTDSLRESVAARLGDILDALGPEKRQSLAPYKPEMIAGPVLRRMTLVLQTSVEGYTGLLRDKAEEREILIRDILIAATESFRASPDQRALIARLVAPGDGSGERDPASARLPEENATRLRQQYAELETLYDSIPLGLSLVDRDLRWLRINSAMAEINGFPPEDHIGKRQEELIPDIDNSIAELQRKVFETGEPVGGLEVSGETPGQPGLTRTWLVDFYPVHDRGEVFAVGACVREITAQRRLEEQAAKAARTIAESEARLRRLFDTVPVFISMHEGPDHVYVYSNPANEAMLPTSEYMGKPLAEVFPIPQAAAALQTFDAAFRSGAPMTRAETEGVKLNADGSPTDEPMWYHHSVVPYFDEAGETLGVMSFAYEITEYVLARKHVEDIAARLTESEARMARLFDEAPAIISILEGPDLRYVYVNPEHDRTTGKPSDELIGRPLREAMPVLEGQGLIALFERVLETGKEIVTDELAAKVDGPDGPTTYYKQIIRPWYAADGSIGGVMSFNYDISELVEAREQVAMGERRLRTIQDSLQSFVGLLDTDGRLLEVNEIALARGGLTRDDVVGKPFWDCWWWSYDPAMQERLKSWVATALTGKTVQEECRVRMEGGEMITIAFNLVPACDDEGRVIEVIPSAIDVTGWRSAETRKDTLLAELQHRVKNSLATVQAIMRFSARTAPSKEALIQSLQDRLGAISRTHDTLTRSDWSGKSLHQIVREEVAPYAGTGIGRLSIDGPDVTVSPEMALPLALAAHELATNAAKYGALSRSGGRVSVTVRADGETLRELEWRESGGPPVSPPKHTGFGSFLLEQVLANDLDSSAEIDYSVGGVSYRLNFDSKRGA